MEKYNNELDFRRFIREAKHLWWLYASALVVFLGAGIFYYFRSMPEYAAGASLLIEDSSENTPSAGAGGVSAIMRSFSIGGFGSSSVDNEIKIMGSNDLLWRVVNRLKLNRTYIERDGLSKKTLFNDSPVILEAPKEMFDTLSRGMLVKIHLDKGKVDVKVTQGRFFFKKTIAEAKSRELPCSIKTPYGNLHIFKSTAYSPDISSNIDVIITSNEQAVNQLKKQLYMEVSDAKTDVISLAYGNPNREKAMAVLNAVMNEYNNVRIERRHTNAAQEVEYFKARMEIVEASLAESEAKLEHFKKDKKLIGIDQEAALLVGGTVGKKEEIVRLQAQINYYQEVLNSLQRGGENILLPMIDQKNPAIEAYNEAIMKRKSLELSATPENKSLQLLNSQIDYLRESIESNMKGLLDQANVTMGTLTQLTGTAVNRINQLPELEREYVNLVRDQKFKNELYMFLLQKQESAELKFYSNSTLGFIIEKAYSELKPKNTKGLIAIIASLLLAVVLPSIAAYIWLVYKNKVYEPMDLSFIGIERNSIFYAGNKSEFGLMRRILTDLPERKTAYVVSLDVDAVNIINPLIDSFKNIGLNSVSDMSIKDNDVLLSKNFNSKLEQQCSENDMVFINVPEPSQLNQISTLIEANNSWLLLIIKSGRFKRSVIKRLLKGFTKSNIASIIVK